MSARLLVSLSGTEHVAFRRGTAPHGCVEFVEGMAALGVGLSLLVAPVPGSPREDAPWLRARVRAGDAIALHGFDRAAHRAGPRGAAGSRRMPAHESGLHLVAALAEMERLGLRTATFVPVSGHVSSGMRVALRDAGFAVYADASAVHELGTGRGQRARVREVCRARGDSRLRRSTVATAARTARLGGLVRLSVGAAELEDPACRAEVLDAVRAAVEHGALPVTYGQLAPHARAGAPRGDRARANSDPITR